MDAFLGLLNCVFPQYYLIILNFLFCVSLKLMIHEKGEILFWANYLEDFFIVFRFWKASDYRASQLCKKNSFQSNCVRIVIIYSTKLFSVCLYSFFSITPKSAYIAVAWISA